MLGVGFSLAKGAQMKNNSENLESKSAGFPGCCKNMKKGVVAGVILGLSVFACVSVANATYIRGAVDVFDVTTPPVGIVTGSYGIGNIIDQSGLANTYVNGVTDFDDFTTGVGATTHSWLPEGNEWWTPYHTDTASIVFDLGGLFTVDRVAFWNEDWNGISTLTISTANETSPFSAVGTFDDLTDNPYEFDYAADILTLSEERLVRYLRFDLTADLLHPSVWGDVRTISIGEVAFSVAEPVPEPATMLLFGTGIMGLLGLKRRKS